MMLDGVREAPEKFPHERARSIDLGYPEKLEAKDPSGTEITISGGDLDDVTLHITKAEKKKVALGTARVVGGLIYGLVNVRTDGDKILCATLDEGEDDWRIKTFRSRF